MHLTASSNCVKRPDEQIINLVLDVAFESVTSTGQVRARMENREEVGEQEVNNKRWENSSLCGGINYRWKSENVF